MERALRFDGATPFAIHDDGTYAAPTPAEIGHLKHIIDERHTDSSPYDIVSDGPLFEASHDEQARATLRAYAEAGATWLIQFTWPDERGIEGIRAAILQGPPSLE